MDNSRNYERWGEENDFTGKVHKAGEREMRRWVIGFDLCFMGFLLISVGNLPFILCIGAKSSVS